MEKYVSEQEKKLGFQNNSDKENQLEQIESLEEKCRLVKNKQGELVKHIERLSKNGNFV